MSFNGKYFRLSIIFEAPLWLMFLVAVVVTAAVALSLVVA